MDALTKVVDAIALLVVLEALGLCGLFAIAGRGVSPGKLLPNLASGFCLILALRSALASNALLVLLCLGLAFAFHLADLFLRWSRS